MIARLAVACSLVAPVLLACSNARAWCQMTTSSSAGTSGCPTDGVPLEWRRRCIEYAIDSRGSRDLPLDRVTDIVGASFGAWTAVTCGGIPVDFDVREASMNALCRRAEYDPEGPNVNVIAFADDWEDRGYDPATYALTTAWHNTRTGEIYDVDLLVNENRGTYGVCPAPAGCDDGTIDLQNVLTHEIGHFFGLAHTQPENTLATMSAVMPPGEVSKRILRSDDIAGFCGIYPPGSLPEECDFTPRHGLELDCEGGPVASDSGIRRVDGGVTSRTRDGGGCGCAATPTGEAPSLPIAWAVLVTLLRHRRSPCPSGRTGRTSARVTGF